MRTPTRLSRPEAPNRPALALLVLALLSCLAAPARSQTFVIGTGTVQNTTTTYPAPYGNWYWGSRHQMLIPAAELAAAGMSSGAIIGLDFDVATVAGQPLQGFTIKLGHSAQASLGTWESNLLQVFGPATVTPAAGWNSHAFCAGFMWDGVQNLVVETCHQNTSFTNNCVFNQSATAYTATRYYRADAAGVCGNAGLTGSATSRPNLRFTAGPPPVTTFQVNQPGASLLVNGVTGSPCSAAISSQVIYNCPPIVPAAGALTLSSTLLGLPWELALGPNPLVPVGQGAAVLSDGQILNIDLSAPLALLNNWFASPLPGASIPGATSASLNIAYSRAAQTDVSLQAVVVDPAATSGLAVSQGAELHVNLLAPAASVPGPVQDNQTLEINVTAGATCWVPGGIPFAGSSYPSIHVSSNGRVVFSAGDSDNSPTQGEGLTDNPFVGFWTDLNPALGGSITVSHPAASLVRVDWAGVPYAGEAATANSFAIMFDAATGQITLDGLSGIQANPLAAAGVGDSQFLGLSKGVLGSTDPGPAAFAPGGSGAPSSPAAMIYDFYNYVAGAPGRCASLGAGVNGIVFTPSAAMPGAYSWSAF